MKNYAIYKYDIRITNGRGQDKVLSKGYDSYDDAREEFEMLCRHAPWGWVYDDGGYIWDAYIDAREV